MRFGAERLIFGNGLLDVIREIVVFLFFFFCTVCVLMVFINGLNGAIVTSFILNIQKLLFGV